MTDPTDETLTEQDPNELSDEPSRREKVLSTLRIIRGAAGALPKVPGVAWDDATKAITLGLINAVIKLLVGGMSPEEIVRNLANQVENPAARLHLNKLGDSIKERMSAR